MTFLNSWRQRKCYFFILWLIDYSSSLDCSENCSKIFPMAQILVPRIRIILPGYNFLGVIYKGNFFLEPFMSFFYWNIPAYLFFYLIWVLFCNFYLSTNLEMWFSHINCANVKINIEVNNKPNYVLSLSLQETPTLKVKLSRRYVHQSLVYIVVNLCDKQTREAHSVFEKCVLAETLPVWNWKG